MTSLIRRVLCVISIVLTASVPSSSMANDQDIDKCATLIRNIVQSRNFELASYCSNLLLRDNPNNVEMQLVRARAAHELGQWDLAIEYSAQTRQHSLTDQQYFVSYLISGMASAAKKKYIVAKVFLRRSANYSHSDQELKIVGAAMSRVRAKSPWSFRLSFNIDPSSNINGGSVHEFGEFSSLGNPDIGTTAQLSEEARAQGGVGYSLNIGVTHKINLSKRALWENSVRASGTLYDGLGRNFYKFSARSGIRFLTGGSTPARWFASIAYDEIYVAEELQGSGTKDFYMYYDQTSFSLERQWRSSAGNNWSSYATYTSRNSGNSDDQDAQILRAGLYYGFDLTDNMTAQIGGYVENTNSESASSARTVQNISMEVNWDVQALPITLSGRISYSNIDYKRQYFIFPDVRHDDNISLRLGVTPENFQFYGFRPTVGVEVIRNLSNLDRFETVEYGIFTRISSVF